MVLIVAQVDRFVMPLLTALLLLLVPSLAVAQASRTPPPRHETTGELSFVGVTGNASSTTLGLGYETTLRPDSWVLKHRLSFVRSEADGLQKAEALLYAPRVEKRLNARVSGFIEYGYFRDPFAGVASRHTGNLGVALTLLDSDRQKLTADVGAGHLEESRLTGADVSSGTYTTGSLYKLKLSDTAELMDRLNLLGTFEDADGWRLEHTMAVTAKLTSVISLKVSSAVRFSRSPAPGFMRTDTTTAVALVASFKQPAPTPAPAP
jgi:putative salt-induced outer membrane protein YdiY